MTHVRTLAVILLLAAPSSPDARPLPRTLDAGRYVLALSCRPDYVEDACHVRVTIRAVASTAPPA